MTLPAISIPDFVAYAAISPDVERVEYTTEETAELIALLVCGMCTIIDLGNMSDIFN